MKLFYVEAYSDEGDHAFHVICEGEADIAGAIADYYHLDFPPGFTLHKIHEGKLLDLKKAIALTAGK